MKFRVAKSPIGGANNDTLKLLSSNWQNLVVLQHYQHHQFPRPWMFIIRYFDYDYLLSLDIRDI